MESGSVLQVSSCGKKKIGIVGLGRIGIEVARRANGFQMGVHGFGNYWPEDEAKEFGIERQDDIGSLAEAVDILSLHTKLTEKTHHMINYDVLGRMKDGSVLINCGRGELVDQDAVIAALDSGKLAGYAADVLDIEPAPGGASAGESPEVNHHAAYRFEDLRERATTGSEGDAESYQLHHRRG